jgi:hypothetical protein
VRAKFLRFPENGARHPVEIRFDPRLVVLSSQD